MNGNALTCSVLIPTRDEAQRLRATLEALAAQDLPADRFEVLVVDHGVADTTPAVIDDLRPHLTLRYICKPGPQLTAAEARNTGVSYARAPICVFLEAGVLPHPGCLNAHLAAHRAALGPAVVYGLVHSLDSRSHRRVATRIEPGRADSADPADPRERFLAKYGDDVDALPAPWLVFQARNASVGTDRLRRLGGYDEALGSAQGADFDLGYRLHRDGARFRLDRQADAALLPRPPIQAPVPAHAPTPIALAAAAQGARPADADLRHIAAKYDTPITRLLPLFPFIDIHTMNDVIRQLGLPDCPDYLARRDRTPRRALAPAA